MVTWVLGLHYRDRSYMEVTVPAASFREAEWIIEASDADVYDIEVLGNLQEGGDWRDEPTPWPFPS